MTLLLVHLPLPWQLPPLLPPLLLPPPPPLPLLLWPPQLRPPLPHAATPATAFSVAIPIHCLGHHCDVALLLLGCVVIVFFHQVQKQFLLEN
jgi:hypothetical protein